VLLFNVKVPLTMTAALLDPFNVKPSKVVVAFTKNIGAPLPVIVTLTPAIVTSLLKIALPVVVEVPVIVELPDTDKFPPTVALLDNVVAPATVNAELSVVFQVTHNVPATVSLPATFNVFKFEVPVDVIFPAVIAPVNVEAPVTSRVPPTVSLPATAKLSHNVVAQVTSKVPPIEALPELVILAEVISSAVTSCNEVAPVAVKSTVVTLADAVMLAPEISPVTSKFPPTVSLPVIAEFHPTDKSLPKAPVPVASTLPVTFKLDDNEVSPVTHKVPSIVTLPVVANVPVDTDSVVKLVIVPVVAVKMFVSTV
jgi:ribonuclease E